MYKLAMGPTQPLITLGTGGCFSGIKYQGVKLTNHLCLVKGSGAIPPIPHMSSWCAA
jgi:hypothetical protein